MSAEVTVLIPSYNPGRYLKPALESVFRQTYPHWRIVLVDDASTDRSLDSVAHMSDDPRIRVVRLSANRGQSRALNSGLQEVTTPWMVQLDSDDWLAPHALEALVTRAQEQPPSVAVIGANAVVVQRSRKARKGRHLIRREILRGRPYVDRYDFLLSNNSIYPRFYRTEALHAIGGWPTDDPYRGRYVEDRRILLRLIERYQFDWIDERLYFYRRHRRNQTRRRRLISYMVKWATRDALRRWGNYWRPVFFTGRDGWTRVVRLVPRRRRIRRMR